MSDFAPLQDAIAAYLTQMTETVTVEAAAKALIEGFAGTITTAVTAALEADANADSTSIAAAVQAIKDATAQTLASSAALKTAILANTPEAPAA